MIDDDKSLDPKGLYSKNPVNFTDYTAVLLEME
jgi:hypothetical protein